MSRLRVAGCGLLLLTACATSNPGTSSAPSQAWNPPPSAVPPVVAQTPATPPAGVIGLADVINVALTNNPATREAWLSAREAEAQLGSRRSEYYPELDVNASITRSKTGASNRPAFLSTTYTPSLALSWLLYDFGGRDAAVEEARQTLIAADFTHNQVLQDVALRATQAYYQLLDARALADAQAATVKERQTELDAAEARHNAGVATVADVLQARTALSQAQLTLESLTGNVRTLEGVLATTMGLPTGTRLQFGVLPANVPLDEAQQAVDAFIGQAATNRPDLASARAIAQRAVARIREVRAQGLPSITLNSNVSKSWFGAPSSLGSTTPWSASVNLHWPVFNGFRTQYDVRTAELDAQLAQEEVRGLGQQIDLQVWTSYFGLQTARQRLATARDLLTSAQQSVDVATARYREGLGTILDVLTAESALEAARAQEVQSRADWFLALAQLAHDTGSLNEGTTK